MPLDSYITSIHDFVINSAQVIFYSNPAMPGNINIPWFGSPIGHNLIDVYLSNATSRAQIAKMIDFEAYYLISPQIYSFDNMKKMQLSMATSMYSLNTFKLQDNTNHIICGEDKCDNNVLFTKFSIGSFNQLILFFPQNGFGSRFYKVLRRNGIPITIKSPNNVQEQENSIHCYHDYEDNDFRCKFYTIPHTQNVVYSAINSNMVEHYGYAEAQYPQMFQDGMFITNEFTVP